ncbi:MAG: Ig-like domain-containing protein, partial [Candidatus Riflebacteria bacterium]|nr:Ig-like domain-containing protein [Candidatus Riflebacteria bacterium]
TVIGPLVTSKSPSNQETNLPLNTPIEILFSKPMNTSLTQSSIDVFPSATLSYEWTNSNKKLRITNSEDWSEYSYIRVVIKEGVKDTDSIAISNPQSCSFRTLLLPDVVTKNCKPEPNAVSVATNTEIIVVFNKEVNKTSAESAFSLKMSNSNVAIAGNFRWEDNKMIFKPQSKLGYNYQYNVRLDATYYDNNGSSPKDSTTWSFKTEENEGNHWSKLYLQNLNDLGFVPRTDHSMVTFNNSLWIIGGLDYSGNPLKDIYKSTNGSSWSLVTNTAPFGARFGHSCTVYNNKIWLSGGITIDDELGVVYLNDVWNSSDGVSWVKVTNARDTSNYVDETLFSRRAFHNMLTYKGKLWVMLGEGPDGLVGDIWSSTDGITWVDRSNIDIPRKNASAIVFNDREDNNYESIFVIGGYGKDSSSQEVALNELVLFKDKNTNWSKKSENLGITKFYGSAAVVYNNRIWLIGGETDSVQDSYVSEALVSNNGINWVTIPFNSDFMPRSNHQAVIFNSMIVISGGKNSDSTFNEVWSIK